MLKASNLHKAYGSLEILKGVDLEINSGEIVSIVGASGAGKSTLLHMLGTLDRPDKGGVSIAGQDVFKLNDKELSAFRNKHIGFVFQFHHLLPEFNAIENVCIPAFISGQGKKESEVRAKELLTMLGLSSRITHKPSELSGGEQQRVAVARALINKPSVILADEPSGNLDSKNSEELHNLFLTLKKEMGQTFIIVTHNKDLAEMSDRKLTMVDGTL